MYMYICICIKYDINQCSYQEIDLQQNNIKSPT